MTFLTPAALDLIAGTYKRAAEHVTEVLPEVCDALLDYANAKDSNKSTERAQYMLIVSLAKAFRAAGYDYNVSSLHHELMVPLALGFLLQLGEQ